MEGGKQKEDGVRMAQSVQRRTLDRKVTSSNPARSGGKIYSPELNFRADFYLVSVPPPCYRSGP